MNHLMVDIETLGTKPGAVIISISAVQFDLATGKTGSKFSTFISLTDSVERGLEINSDTVVWWLGQDKDSQNELLDGIMAGKGKTLATALMDFNSWTLNTFGGGKDFEIWGNSARFDLGLLSHAYDLIGLKPGWNHRNERDVRTLVSFAPEIKEGMTFVGIKHDGFYDCLHQIKYCHATYNVVMGNDNYHVEEEITG